jgi:hypothetical protein
LPSGNAGIDGEIDGAIQHAPHPGRQSIVVEGSTQFGSGSTI